MCTDVLRLGLDGDYCRHTLESDDDDYRHSFESDDDYYRHETWWRLTIMFTVILPAPMVFVQVCRDRLLHALPPTVCLLCTLGSFGP